MAKRRSDSNRRNSGRRNFAGWLMMLLPGFMFLGLLAPAAVSVKPNAEDSYGPISFRNFSPRHPFNVPLHMAHAIFENEAVDTVVFSGARYLAEQSMRAFELDTKANDDQIVLASNDGAADYVAETLFGAAGDEVQLTVDLIPLWDPAVFDVIPGLIARNGWSQWDEFHGIGPGHAPRQPVIVPEPTTGALLAFGLGALALRRRRTA
jgi:PEP-CTERM motif-containing protein